MAQQLPMEEYNQAGVDAIASAGKPIPGQSLTSDPDQVRPFEGQILISCKLQAASLTMNE